MENKNPDLPIQPDTLQQQPTLVKKNSNPIWKIIFIIFFIVDALLAYSLAISGGYITIYSLTAFSFALLPSIVNLLLFLDTFQNKFSSLFAMRIWLVICILLLIFNVISISWAVWIIIIAPTALNLLAVILVAIPLAINDFIAILYYIIQKRHRV